ncbi:MAG: VWA domain-containing protein [Bacteroidetes bacterium]|nr:VWA domain-containing protein [Bacteroidota bacterium]
MQKLILILFTFFSVTCLFSQTSISTNSHDFGELNVFSDRYMDVVLSSTGTKKNYLLRIKKPNEVVFLVKGKELTQDSIITIRLQVNPKQKGKFKHEIEIFTSDRMEPFYVKLTGDMTENPPNDLNAFQNCPAFGSNPTNATDFKMNIAVIDAETKLPIEKSTVHIVQNGRSKYAFRTNDEGRISEKVPLGYSYFYVSKDGYEPAETGTYVNSQRNQLVLELKKKEELVQIVQTTTTEDQVVVIDLNESSNEKAEEESIVELKVEDPFKEEQPIVEIKLEDKIKEEEVFVPTALTGLSASDFSETYFKPVNVTFVLDISSSMRAGDKMELLKFSLNSLNQQLRAQDKVSLVTYADNARSLIAPIAGDERATMEKTVDDLKASGLTAGGEGIKLGYKENMKGFLSDGANHVIVITDGAFNRNSKDYQKYVRKYKRKGITLSIVGIKNKETDAGEMEDAAKLGGGRYIPIMKLADAQNNLFQEIRLITYKY